jgi:hypothetical protein
VSLSRDAKALLAINIHGMEQGLARLLEMGARAPQSHVVAMKELLLRLKEVMDE